MTWWMVIVICICLLLIMIGQDELKDEIKKLRVSLISEEVKIRVSNYKSELDDNK